MDWLGKVADNHSEYIKYVHKMGSTTHAEDLVQEMYLRLVRYKDSIRFNDNGTVPKSYIYRILFNIFKDYQKSSSKFLFHNIDYFNHLETEQESTIREEAYERVMQKMFREMDELDNDDKYAYNKELFNLYANTAMSMRCISDVTTISLSSIFNTIKQCRIHLSEELREDIEDFNNGEYELIK